jgi:hypothetical protein
MLLGLACLLQLAELSGTALAAGSTCQILRTGTFPGDGENVRLVRGEGLAAAGQFAVYKAPLAVNTDGAPTSYHPDDFLGRQFAINRIDNGIAISKPGQRLTTAEKRAVFEQWRNAGWVVPSGYRISWSNVIADDGHGKPCVFQGEPAGYFGSLTALKNGLSGAAAGECQAKDQLDQRFIPAIVLRGSGNPLRDYGARTGDLVLAINPQSGATVAAIIGDTGDGNRIGEASVALNMALLGVTTQPRTYSEALQLDTGTRAMVVAALPGTRQFERLRPYTAENIATRVAAWATAHGYAGTEGLATMAKTCAQGL